MGLHFGQWEIAFVLLACSLLAIQNRYLSNALKRIDDLNGIIEELPIGVFGKDCRNEMRYVIWNKKVAESSGISSEQVLGKNCHEVFNNEMAEQFEANDKAAMGSGGPVEFPVEHVPFEGRPEDQYLHTRLQCLRDSQGRPSLLLGMTDDITLRRKQESLQGAENRFQLLWAISESIPQLVFVTNAKGKGVYFNRRWVKYTGHVLGKATSWEDIIHPEDVVLSKEHWIRCIRTGEDFQTQYRLKQVNGTYRWFLVRACAIRSRTGEIENWFGTCTDINEQKAAELSNLRLAAIIENSDDAIIGLDLEGHVTSWNHGAETLFGYSTAEMLGQKTDRLYPKGHQSEFLTLHQRIREGERIQNHDTERLSKDGKIIPVSLTLSAIRSKAGTLVGMSKILRDRSSAREAETLIKESETRFRQLADSMPQIVWSTRADGTTDYYNQRWYDYTGFPRGETGDSSWVSILPKEDAERALNAWHTAVETGQPYQIEYRYWDRKTQTYRWHLARALPVRDESGKILRWFGTSTDIHDQKTLEIEQKKFVSLIENTTDFIGICDLSQNVLYVNCAGLRMVGRENYQGARVAEFFTPQDYTLINETVIPQVIKKGKWEGETSFFDSRAGKRTPVWMNAFPLLDRATGKICGIATVSRDLTERKISELENLQLLGREQAALEASQMKSSFLANMSHEIRTPLNGIIGMSSLLLRSNADARQLEYAGAIKESAETLLHLLNDVLDLSKVESGKLELESIPFNLTELLDSVATFFRACAEQKNLTFTTALPKEPVFISGDPTRIRQVLNNLLSNAIKFTHQGSIHWSVRNRVAGGKTCRIVSEVRDTGVGIPEDKRERIFGVFSQGSSSTTREFGGSGLGLSIVKRLVEAMDGKLGFESTPGKGTRFWFEVSCPTAIVPKRSLHPKKVRSTSDGLQILVAEDNPVNFRVTQSILEELGHKVVGVTSGLAALKQLESNHFDLVFMDCQMPELDGLEATRRVRSSKHSWSRIPIIALTADAYPESRKRCLEAGMTDYIAKPFQVSDFETVLARWSKTPCPVIRPSVTLSHIAQA
ncbi:PAS domain S-box protein [bacterium]|nr:PAS domain S-box protein [bacterium]